MASGFPTALKANYLGNCHAYRLCGPATVRDPVLEASATVQPFENQRGFSLRVHRAGKPRTLSNP